ncbi:uncharacterized protein [Montipora foliosa]|uniref:uncharacterized protein n=1 Tax=Montipora foliosa TaxID=591990 RepID=UPI0035F1F4CB
MLQHTSSELTVEQILSLSQDLIKETVLSLSTGSSILTVNSETIDFGCQQVQQYPTTSREESLISYLRGLKQDEIISSDTFQEIIPYGSTPGILNGLPKIHKPGCPFRPIVSSVNTYNYNLESFLLQILHPISKNKFAIKASFSFVDWAKSYKHNNEILCSFDVSSLFSDVPLDETIQIFLTKLYVYSFPDPPKRPPNVLKKLLEFATRKSHFLFDGNLYDEINDVAMGSPLGKVLPNIFICHFEEKWIQNSKDCPPIWFRYVNDTFTFFQNKEAAEKFLRYINNRHTNINFTVELEMDNQIPF